MPNSTLLSAGVGYGTPKTANLAKKIFESISHMILIRFSGFVGDLVLV